MVRFGYAIGVLMLAAGLGLGLWGAPYHMLDWGGALMMSGAVLGSAGAIVLLLAAVLAQLRRMAFAGPASVSEPAPPARVEPAFVEPGVADGKAVDTPDADIGPPVSPAPSQPAPAPPSAPAAASAPLLPGTAMAGGAAAAGGLATAAASILSSVSSRPEEAGAQVRAALESPDRDALFSRVETAVRALKADADSPRADGTEESAQPPEDFSDLRADLRSAPDADDGDTLTHVLDRDEPPAGHDDDPTVAETREEDAAREDDAHNDDAPDDHQAPAQPPVSEEGVIAAYTVGDVSYTMFADGRIRADSPEGEQTFASMDELKEHMARRRLGG